MTSTQCDICYYTFTYEPNDLIVKHTICNVFGDEETYDMYYVKCPSCQKEIYVRRELTQYVVDVNLAFNRDVHSDGFWLLEKNGEARCLAYYSHLRNGIHIIYGIAPLPESTYNSPVFLLKDGFIKLYQQQEKIDRLVKQLTTNPKLVKINIRKSWF